MRRKLLAWYRRCRRDLPWRRTRDPYAIWVSEIMLQQTRVAAVVPYYERFLRRFPDVGTLSRARLDTVLAHWSGLGYYRRARHLHAAARVVAKHGVPGTEAEWRALPGVGVYTAAAIASIAFGERAAVVDGNVERVLSRLHAACLGKREARERAQALLSPRSPGDFNQAVMELGATVCTPRAPDCPACPVQESCRGRGAPERYPAPRARRKPVVERRAVLFTTRGGRVFLRRIEARLLEGMWDLPPARRHGEPLARILHGVVHKRLVVDIYPGPARGPAGPGRWFCRADLDGLPLATAARKCLRKVGYIA